MEEAATIWPPHEAFYLSAMLAHTTPAVASISAVADAVEAMEAGTSVVDRAALLNHLQDAVHHGAAISTAPGAAGEPAHQRRPVGRTGSSS